jgi:phospholipid/cholesterol/gamma-HCH transport system substrate-binding protein
MTHAAAPETPRKGLPTHLLYRLYGVGFIVVIALLLGLVYAMYNKSFVSVVNIKVDTDHAGLQLLDHSDVKVRGVIVGEVRGIRTYNGGAQISLAIDPGKAKLIPVDSRTRMLPKTLFGEKYVDIEVQPGDTSPHIRNGSVLHQDTSQETVELNQVLDNLLPLLKAVQPEKLNVTLNALATALQGRGDQLGQTLVNLDYLLKKVNPDLPNLTYDIKALANVSNTYSDATPDILRTLSNLNVTSQTITDRQNTIQELIPAVTQVSNKADRFVSANANKIIGVNIASLPALQLAATYSPELPCVFQGLVKFKPIVEGAVGGRNPYINLTIEIVKPRPAYKPGIDDVKVQDQRGPRCYGLPNPPVPFPDYTALDGTQNDDWWNNNAQGSSGTGGTGGTAGTAGSRNMALTSGLTIQPGSATTDQSMIKSIVAPMLKTPSSQVPDVAGLLFGPLFNGGVVTMR